MAYVVRTKDNPGDVGRAADQQQGVDNESALYAAILGNGPVAAGGMVKQFVKKTGIADNTATELFTITTTNEAGDNDGGVYAVFINGLFAHGVGPLLETSAQSVVWHFSRAVNASAAAGNSSTGAYWADGSVAASTAATKSMVVTALADLTYVETSEYVVSVRVRIDLNGTTVTTGCAYAMVELIYAGFTTPPVITSAG